MNSNIPESSQDMIDSLKHVLILLANEISEDKAQIKHLELRVSMQSAALKALENRLNPAIPETPK